MTDLVAVAVEEGLEIDDIRMRNGPHDLEFSVLESERGSRPSFRQRRSSGRSLGEAERALTLKRLSWRTFLIAISSMEVPSAAGGGGGGLSSFSSGTGPGRGGGQVARRP